MNATLSNNTRILSLDVFRGLTIVLMILVNSQGTSHPYYLLDHADWNGCTFADLVFPSFLFIVGVTISVSLSRQLQSKSLSSIYPEVLQRSFLLFILGVFLNAIPFHFNLETIRIFGILQRIAFCYLFAALIYLNTHVKTQIIIFISILVFYWIFLTKIPVPGSDVAQLGFEGNWAAYLDQKIFSPAHLLEKTFDPEGFLTNIVSIATTLSGVLIGHLLLSLLSNYSKFVWMIVLACLSILLGWLWSYDFPLNKQLWSSSYVLFTSGISLFAFSLCFLIIDIGHYKKWAWPLKVFGMNALFAFILHVLLLKMQFIFQMVLKDGTKGNLKEYLADFIFGFMSPQNAALSYSILFLLLNFAVVVYLYRNKIFIRI